MSNTMAQRSVTPPALKVLIRGQHTQLTNLQYLPQEILLMISVWLPLLDLVSLSQVRERDCFLYKC